ncbi:MAG: ComEC/Rec2 family competence protein [Candidatus Hydrothermae bacterium]|nr:ComEC/Rec2 family competence protein [Candidatus Hydrothermae bacterium]
MLIFFEKLNYVHFLGFLFLAGGIRNRVEISTRFHLKRRIRGVRIHLEVSGEGRGEAILRGTSLNQEVYWGRWPSLPPGSKIFLAGDLLPLDLRDEFDRYLFHSGIDCRLRARRVLKWGKRSLRGRALRSLRRRINRLCISRKCSGLMRAFLLGERRSVPAEIKRKMRLTGTMHLLALSGLHVGLIFSVFFFMLGLFRGGRRTTVLLSMVFLYSYLYLVGLRASLWRAVLLITGFMLGLLFERKSYGLNSLGFSGLIFLFLFPEGLFEGGFQLSYLATFGILYSLPVISRFSGGKKAIRYLVSSLTVSLAAQLFTLPVSLALFGGFSPLSPFVNLLAIPGLWLILTWMLLGLTFSFLSVRVALSYTVLAEKGLGVLLWVIDRASSLPGAFQKAGSFPPALCFLYYCILLIMIKTLHRGRWKKE